MIGKPVCSAELRAPKLARLQLLWVSLHRLPGEQQVWEGKREGKARARLHAFEESFFQDIYLSILYIYIFYIHVICVYIYICMFICTHILT